MEGSRDVKGTMGNGAEAPRLKRTVSDCSLGPDTCNVLESRAMFISPQSDWHQHKSSLKSPEIFTETLARTRSSPCTLNGAGLVVDESTLKNSTVGCSNSRDEIPPREGHWQHLYQLAGRFRNGNPDDDLMSKEPIMSGGGEDVGNKFLHKIWSQKPLPSKHLTNRGNFTVLSQTFTGYPGGIRKVLPVSESPQFVVENASKGKGAVCRHSETHDQSDVVILRQNDEKGNCDAVIASDASQGSTLKANDLSLRIGDEACVGSLNDGISLREWLKPGCRKVNKIESLRLFKQILKLVDLAHSHGIVLQDIRPSCFMIFSSDKVTYVGSWDLEIQMDVPQSVMNQEAHYLEHHTTRKRYLEQGMHPPGYDFRKQQNSDKRPKASNMSGSPRASNLLHWRMSSESMQLEERWYTSPEELNAGVRTLSSNIYNLGFLLFELFCCFETLEVHDTAMSDLHHRILPPNFIWENPKEADFCIWLLHPEPSFRPKTREILQSELILEARDLSSRNQSPLSVDEEDSESELLLHFLISLKEQKQEEASMLGENLGCLNSDIEEVERRHSMRTEFLSKTNKDFNISDEYLLKEPLHEVMPQSSMSRMNESRLMRNINQLENAYFSMRSKILLPETEAAPRFDKDILKNQGRLSPTQNEIEDWCINKSPTDPLGAFFDGIYKYAQYRKFEIRGTLRNGDLLNSTNVICSLGFDRDEDYFATAGVSKKIKIFEFSSLLSNTADIHYPVIEMSNKSKLSCVCWNNYIKNYLASSDYDGVVQLWDANTGQSFSQYTEHQMRAWSVDFSQVDPMKLASGSDDCSVKLWSINEENCISTIRNVANVCCVQFSSHSTHFLAFGSADYKIFCYDLRNTRVPWCTLAGHGKAVSYVKFLDTETLVSASTDNTLKLWDLNKTISSGLSTTACISTLSGHTNEKNFVGLSVSDGYIACGSETNEGIKRISGAYIESKDFEKVLLYLFTPWILGMFHYKDCRIQAMDFERFYYISLHYGFQECSLD
ncbi:protein SPA1-RELATED 2-like isoform X2 [Tasmannia lanceolata]|uniref:protein SPA1-RELATED 2-like isoform X2 n=1 Tax=Tasmannia lanceolata TaxID=3420 RepID=UPI00406307C0